MDILIIAGIAFVLLSVILIVKRSSNREFKKKINYKDRIKLETILEDENITQADTTQTDGKQSDSPVDILNTFKIKDDEIISLVDEGAKYYERGVALVKEKRYEESIPQLNEAIKLNPSEAAAYYYRGIAKIELKLFDDAISDFTDAMLHQTSKIDAFFQRGSARLKVGDKENALLDFSHYISTEKNNPEAYYMKGILEFDKGNFQRAIDDFTNAIILNPNHASAYFKRGMAKQKTGNLPGCCKDLKIAFDKGNLEAFHFLKEFCK